MRSSSGKFPIIDWQVFGLATLKQITKPLPCTMDWTDVAMLASTAQGTDFKPYNGISHMTRTSMDADRPPAHPDCPPAAPPDQADDENRGKVMQVAEERTAKPKDEAIKQAKDRRTPDGACVNQLTELYSI